MKKSDNLKWYDSLSRFLWIDNNTIKLMNKEGMEKIIDISTNEFKELSYNKRSHIDNLI